MNKIAKPHPIKVIVEINSMHDCVPGIPDPHISDILTRVVLQSPYIVGWQGTIGSRYIDKIMNRPIKIKTIYSLDEVFC